jgi:hypothetical protein
MANGDGPWTKYQSAAPQHGPWEKFAQADTPKPSQAQPVATPIDKASQGTISAQPSLYDRIKSSAKAVAMDPFKLPEAIGSMTSGIENYTPEGRAEHPVLSKVGDITKSGKDYARLLASAVSATGGAGIGGPEALETAGEATIGRLSSKADPLQKINKLLGVSAKDLVPGKVPGSLEEFAANPARGAMNAGLNEKTLAKMDVYERNAAIMQAKDKAGKMLDNALLSATQQGKTVNLQPAVEKIFKGILDPNMGKQAENAVLTLMKKNGVTDLSKITPVQAKAMQEGLDEFTGIKEVSEQLTKGIKEAIKKAVPEIGPLNQHYWDLKNASQGTQKMLKQFGKEAPENKLRKMFMQHAVKGAGWAAGGSIPTGIAYEYFKHKSP